MTVLFVKKHYLKLQPHPPFSSSSRHLREAIRTSPQPGLSESGLSLSWGWAKLPQSHRSKPARPSLPGDSVSNRRDQNRPKSQKLTWPERHPYSLTLHSSTLPPSPSISFTFRASELFSCDPQRGERCNLSPLPHPFTPTAFLPLTPPTHSTHTQTHTPLPPLFVVTWS